MKEYNFKPVNAYENEDEDNGTTFYELLINVGEPGLQEAENLFEAHENYPNGPGWEGLITYIMEQECPELIEYFEFDSEGDTFLAISKEEDKMLQLATLLQSIILDSKRLTKYLEKLPEAYKYA